MTNDNNRFQVSPETLKALVTSLAQSELIKIYAYGVKNLRSVVLITLMAVILCSSAILGLSFIVFGIMSASGMDFRAMGIAAMILGFIVMGLVLYFGRIIAKESFWLKIFKINHMVDNLPAPTSRRGDPV